MSKRSKESVTVTDGAGRAATIDGDDLEALANASTILVPTWFQPHLCVTKRSKDDKEARREHGVTFRKVAGGVVMEAQNRIVTVSILLSGKTGLHVSEVTVPAALMALVAEAAAADIDMAQLMFIGHRVRATIGNSTHEYPLIQADLPFPGQNVRELGFGKSGSSFAPRIDALQLAKVQRALNANQLELRRVNRGLVALLPDGDDRSGNVGYLHTGEAEE